MKPTVKTTLPCPEVYEGGSGPPLVLIHGFTETWRLWIPILKYLEPHYRVIVPTLPGHIGGLELTEPASPLSIASALAKQLRERGITNAHFVGQSLGGWVTFEMVREGLARSALGLAPGGAIGTERFKLDFIRRSRAMVKALPYIAPVMLLLSRVPALRKILFAGEMRHADRMPFEVVEDRLNRVRKMTIFNDFLAFDLQTMEALPADCKTPLRVVWCEEDTTLPFDDCGQPLLDLLGLESAVMLKDCGHNPMFDDPEAVANAILEFARSVDLAAVR